MSFVQPRLHGASVDVMMRWRKGHWRWRGTRSKPTTPISSVESGIWRKAGLLCS
ncbi:hypothetical protein GAY33_15285 [Azospirillum brasilense]|nr:hypothetical protein [Azospirillum argentinense]